MNSRRRVTAALVALLLLVAVAWLVQQASSDEPSPASLRGAGFAAELCWLHCSSSSSGPGA